jgi:hypothetical protein
MFASMTEIRMQTSMEHIIRRLEAIHRALQTAPASFAGDPRVTEAVARCLRHLCAIAVQSSADDGTLEARLRLIAAPPCRLH